MYHFTHNSLRVYGETKQNCISPEWFRKTFFQQKECGWFRTRLRLTRYTTHLTSTGGKTDKLGDTPFFCCHRWYAAFLPCCRPCLRRLLGAGMTRFVVPCQWSFVSSPTSKSVNLEKKIAFSFRDLFANSQKSEGMAGAPGSLLQIICSHILDLCPNDHGLTASLICLFPAKQQCMKCVLIVEK
jgi:hypothetical protein